MNQKILEEKIEELKEKYKLSGSDRFIELIKGYFDSGEYKLAEERAQALNFIDPDNFEAVAYLALSQLKLGNGDEAQRTIEMQVKPLWESKQSSASENQKFLMDQVNVTLYDYLNPVISSEGATKETGTSEISDLVGKEQQYKSASSENYSEEKSIFSYTREHKYLTRIGGVVLALLLMKGACGVCSGKTEKPAEPTKVEEKSEKSRLPQYISIKSGGQILDIPLEKTWDVDINPNAEIYLLGIKYNKEGPIENALIDLVGYGKKDDSNAPIKITDLTREVYRIEAEKDGSVYKTFLKLRFARQREGDEIDNDRDGRIDEEVYDHQDNDGDGKIDEDLKPINPRGPKIIWTKFEPDSGPFGARTNFKLKIIDPDGPEDISDITYITDDGHANPNVVRRINDRGEFPDEKEGDGIYASFGYANFCREHRVWLTVSDREGNTDTKPIYWKTTGPPTEVELTKGPHFKLEYDNDCLNK